MESNLNIEEVHISQIMVRDTILYNDGTTETVYMEHLKYNSFMGITLFGDSYRLGTILVKRLITK